MAIAGTEAERISPVDENRLSYRGWLAVIASMIALTVGPSTIIMNFGLFIRPIQGNSFLQSSQ